MKRAFGYGIAVFALCAAPALAQSGTTSSSGSRATTQSGSSATSGTRSQSGSATGSQSGTTTGSQAGTRSSSQAGTLSSADRQFVMEAARGGMAEVELGQLASQKAQSDQVKQFGQRMVEDRGKANDELKSLAQQKSITLPTELDAKHKATRDRLSKLSGAQFDRAYVQDMLQDHRKDVNEFRKKSQSANDPDVKAWAAKTLPTLEEHLRLVQSLEGAVGTSGTRSNSSGTKGTSGSSSGSTSGAGATSGSGSSTGSNNPR